MVSLDHGTPLFKGYVPERSQSSSADYGKNALRKKLGQQPEKRRWEVKIKLSRYIPRKPKEVLITPEVRIFLKLTLENISLEADVILSDEVGHFAKYCPKRQNKKNGNKKRHHAHAAEDDEPSKKKTRYESETLQVKNNMS